MANAERYVAGRNEGLKSFCPYERFSEGRAGHAYAAGCPQPQGGQFLAGYHRGRELHELHRRLVEVEKDIARTKAAQGRDSQSPRTRQ